MATTTGSNTENTTRPLRRINLIVEGKDDKEIYRKFLFKDLLEECDGKVVVLCPGDNDGFSRELRLSSEASGCRAVLNRVEENRGSRFYFGLVDRDFLLSEAGDPSYFWELDDHEFAKHKLVDGQVFVLNRWELENYLLHPRALFRFVHAETNLPDVEESYSSFVNALKELADFSTYHTATNILIQMAMGHEAKTMNFWQVKNELEKRNTENDCDGFAQILSDKTELRKTDAQEKIQTMVQKLRAFCQSSGEPYNEEAWLSINRALDGKNLLACMKDKWKCSGKLELNSKRHLANYINAENLQDPFLKNIFERLKEEAQSC